MLFWIDIEAYTRLGRSVTGARYQKLPKGPAARALVPVRDELVAEGAVEVREPAAQYETRRTTARRNADLEAFTEAELELVGEIIGRVEGRSATAVSELSHESSPGWNLVALGEDIPYSAALISTEPLRDETMGRVRAAAARLGW